MDTSFAERVNEIVSTIPEGKVMTYGQIAAMAGNARAARIVGGIAHYGDPSLPWHRVVNKKGELASGYHGGRRAQKEHLEAEGVSVHGDADSYFVDVETLLWRPKENNQEMSNQISTINYQIYPQELYIVGPTASGKSSLAIEVARLFEGEIICADSQTLRKHLDIGTAKPSSDDQQKVRHHLVDIIEPFEEFSVAQFKNMAVPTIEEIKACGKLPIIVGGSGMYVDSLYFDYTINEHNTNYSREELESRSVRELQSIILDKGWKLPENAQNPRHLIGVIMRGGESYADREQAAAGKCIIGLLPDDEELKQRINSRVERMFEQGLVEEVNKLIERYGDVPERMDAIGYPIVAKYLHNEIALQQAKEEFARGHWQYARKQKAWFKRNKDIVWFTSSTEALGYIKSSMNKYK